MWFSVARFALLKLRKYDVDPRNWRPHIISFTRDIAKDLDLVYLANCFNQKHGIVTACRIIEGDLAGEVHEVRKARNEMNEVLAENEILAFCEVNISPDFKTGALNMVQANGIAGLHSNTVMFGWPKEKEKLVAQLQIMRTISAIQQNTIISKLLPIDGRILKDRIDIWWGGLEYNGDLMLLLAYLLKMNREWENARIIIHTIVLSPEERDGMRDSLLELIQSVRIEAEMEIIIKDPEKSLNDIIKASSRDADLIFIGLMVPEEGDEESYADRLMELSEGLPSTIFVRNSSRFSGRLI